MKVQSKQQKGKSQANRLKQQKQISGQENENFELKVQKVQKQLASLSLDIQSLLEQRNFKDNTQKALVRQRKKLQNCFLFKDYQASKQIDQIQKQDIQSEAKCIEMSKQKVKNHFRDVNQTILRYIKQLQPLKEKEGLIEFQNSEDQAQNQYQQPNRKLQCQSLHLKQIFNPQQTLTHQIKASKLQQKLALLYDTIKLNLQREEPYLHEKILERIKRQAQSYTRKKLLQQIDKLIKQNSVWMTQETNRVNNQLEEQKVEEICVNNLGLMKKIMGKKVANNDWIFQNYSDTNFIKSSTLGFPAQKITHQYQEVLKRLQEQRIADQLKMIRKGNNGKMEKNSKQSLKQLLSDKQIQNLMSQKRNQQDSLIQSERQLVERVEELQKQIQNLTKV